MFRASWRNRLPKRSKSSVTGAEHQRLAAARSVAPEVYETYLKGHFAYDHSDTRAEVEESIVYFQHAIEMDPTFAPAYVGLADASNELGTVIVRRSSRGDARESNPQLCEKRWSWSRTSPKRMSCSHMCSRNSGTGPTPRPNSDTPSN